MKENNSPKIKEELFLGNNIDLIYYNRPGNKRGGGVALAFKSNEIKLEENKFKRESLEIDSAVGRLNNEKRKIVIYGLYLPPGLTAAKASRACELVNDNLSVVKAKYESPLIIIGGDFNQFDISQCFVDHPDVSICPSEPTRGNARLDLIATNAGDHFVDSYTTTPLDNNNGSQSDHKPLTCQFRIPSVHCFEIIKYTTRKYTRANEEKFVSELNGTDWEELYICQNASDKTRVLHDRINQLMDRFFPLRTYSVKSTDDPWISQHYKKEARKRRKEYKLHGKSAKFKRLQKENNEELSEAKKEFYIKECNKLTTPGSHVVSFNAIKHVNTPSRPKPWQPANLFPGLTIEIIMEKMGDFFNGISVEFVGLKPDDLPRTYDREVFDITPEIVIDKIKKMKRT